LKSVWRSNEGRYIQKRGSKPGWPEKGEGMGMSKRARRRKLDTAQDAPEATTCGTPEGMRRGTGPQSMGKPSQTYLKFPN